MPAPRRVAELAAPGDVPLWVHPEWAERFPWLVQGTTGRGTAAEPFDLGLSREQPVGAVLQRWRMLRQVTGLPAAVHARQVHGADLAIHETASAPGLLVMEDVDGHVTRQAGLLLTVSVADCVPVSIVGAERKAVALVHAGWRGTAAGIVERALANLAEAGETRGLWLHCGPAICGECYEVGPEVHRGVRPGQPAPAAPTPIDLRAAIAERAASAGLPAEHVSASAHCTRCGPGAFFSHRDGSTARQMAVLGVRQSSGPELRI